MRAAIVAPPIRDFYFTPRRDAALGAHAVAQELQQHGVQATVTVFPAQGPVQSVDLPSELDYLRPFVIPGETGPTSWFTGYRRFGLTPKSAAEQVLAENPDTIFVSSFAWAYSDDVIALARAVRELHEDLPIVVGGHGPTVDPATYRAASAAGSDNPLFSLVVAGEAEGRIPEVLAALDSGTGFLDLRASHKTSAPPPPTAVCAAPQGRIGVSRVSIMLTRGCPFACEFCATHITHGNQFRSSPPETWLPALERALRMCPQPAGPLLVNIEDDNVLCLDDELYDFLETARDRYPDVRFSAENGLDYRLMEPADVDRLAEAGFGEINLSLGAPGSAHPESGARRIDTSRFEAVVGRAATLRLPLTTHFICGSAGDSPESTAQALRYLRSLPTRVGISPFYPVPGLPGFQNPAVFKDRPPRLALGSSLFPWNGSLATQDFVTAFRLARFLNLRRRLTDGERLSDPEAALIRIIEATNRLHTLVRHGGSTEAQPVPNLNDDLVAAVMS